ncbi:MAG: YlbF family regulator [Syntrophomonadaceae bacterium]|nr:YlbF family regulator [Syntrophomonadaceae bacterium]
MSLMAKAQELGYALLETEEATILHAAEKNLDSSPESLRLINEYQRKFQQIKKAQDAGEEVSDEVFDEFNQLQEKVNADKNIQAYFSAQQKFNQLLQQVNAVINQVLRGETCSPDCCDDCSGCS